MSSSSGSDQLLSAAFDVLTTEAKGNFSDSEFVHEFLRRCTENSEEMMNLIDSNTWRECPCIEDLLRSLPVSDRSLTVALFCFIAIGWLNLVSSIYL